ncbi:MAG: TetR family transcriptional regulator [Microbacteriaceae bacterium]|nr:MAG: TetR family transcriptional regulator [Microbacteriaceae bacterium]
MNGRTSPRELNSKRLDRATIVAAGLEIASRPGIAAISVRALGTELGVDPTAVYRHFQSKDDLMRALLDELQASSLSRLPEGAPWRERLRSLAHATLATFVAHPAIAVEATVLATNGPAETATIEFILAAFAEAGLEGGDLASHYALFASYVLSEAAGISRGRASSPDSTEDSWLEGPLLVDPLKHAHIASVAAELRDLRDEDIFRMGIELILDSATRSVAARSAAARIGTAGGAERDEE